MKVLYYLTYAVLWLFSLLPMWVHYLISDGIYVVVYHLVGYRKKLVRKNLTDSFPEKSETEISQIEKAFYSWFCDYLVETIKLLTISKRNLKRRMVFKGMRSWRADSRVPSIWDITATGNGSRHCRSG